MDRSKRIICRFLVLCLLLSCAFTGCAKREKNTKEVLTLLLSKTGYIDACALYDYDELKNTGDGNAFFASLFGDDTLRTAFCGADEGALAFSRRDDGFEIQIYRTGHPSQALDIAKVLRDREASLKSVGNKRYLAENFDKYLSSASVYVDGVYAFLLATGDNDALLSRLKELLR